MDDEISADFYIAVPDILSKLVPLKNKLRKKFPKSKRGQLTVGLKPDSNGRCHTSVCERLLFL